MTFTVLREDLFYFLYLFDQFLLKSPFLSFYKICVFLQAVRVYVD